MADFAAEGVLIEQRLARGRAALASAETLEEVIRIRGMAGAARKMAGLAKLGLAVLNDAAEIKIEAEAQAGQAVAALRLRGGDRKSKDHVDRLTLADLGVTQNDSTRWQRLARIPSQMRAKYFAACREQHAEISASGLARFAATRSRATSQRSCCDEVIDSRCPHVLRMEETVLELQSNVETLQKHLSSFHSQDQRNSKLADSCRVCCATTLEQQTAHIARLTEELRAHIERIKPSNKMFDPNVNHR